MESEVAAGAMAGSFDWSASGATAAVVEEIVGPSTARTLLSPASLLKAFDASVASPLSSMLSSLIFLPFRPPLALISLMASLKPLSSASPYAAAVPEFVVMLPSVIVLPLAAPAELLESSMLPPEQAAMDIIMAAAAAIAVVLPKNFAFIRNLPLYKRFWE